PDVAGEILAAGVVEVGLVVEVDDERLVVRVGAFDERECGGFDFGALVFHAAAVVDDQAEGYRNVFVFESADLLRNFVLGDGERGSRQTADEVPALIEDRGVQDYQAGIRAESCFFLRRLGTQQQRPASHGQNNGEWPDAVHYGWKLDAPFTVLLSGVA